MNYIYTWLGFAAFIACVTIIPAYFGHDYAAGYKGPFQMAQFLWAVLVAICAVILLFIWSVKAIS